MKTYKQKYQRALDDKQKLYEQFVEISAKYNALLADKVDVMDSKLMTTIVETLQDIRKQGGAYSSVKAIELLAYMGKL